MPETDVNIELNEVIDRSSETTVNVSDNELANRYNHSAVTVNETATTNKLSPAEFIEIKNVLSVDRYNEYIVNIQDDVEVDLIDDSDRKKKELIWLIMGKPTWLHRGWQGKTRGGKE